MKEIFNKIVQKIDYKIAIIISLVCLVIILLLTKNDNESYEIDYQKEEIKELHRLNDSAYGVIKNLDEEILKIDKNFALLQRKYDKAEIKNIELKKIILDLKVRYDEIPTNVNSLDAAGVKSQFDDYIERKNANNN